MKINFKNFGFLEFLVLVSAIFVIGMLIWTASTRPAVEAKANLVKENHNKVVDLINNLAMIAWLLYIITSAYIEPGMGQSRVLYSNWECFSLLYCTLRGWIKGTKCALFSIK